MPGASSRGSGTHARLPNTAVAGRTGGGLRVTGGRTGGPRLPGGRTGAAGTVLSGNRVTLSSTSGAAATVNAGGASRLPGNRVTPSGSNTSIQVAGKAGAHRLGSGPMGGGLGLTGPLSPFITPQLINVAQGYNQQLYNDLKAGNPLSQGEINELVTIAQSYPGKPIGNQAAQAAAAATAYNNAVSQGNKPGAGVAGIVAGTIQGTLGALAGLSGGIPRPGGGGLGSYAGGADALPGICGGMPTMCCPVDGDDPDGAALVLSLDPGSVDAASDDGQDQEETPWQTSRYIRVANATKEKITLYLQVRTQNEEDDWLWYPAAPGADEALSFELAPGQAAQLSDGDWPINGNRVRLWAESKTQQYLAFRDKDLWLVPEIDCEGYHDYQSPDVQTFEVAIR
jgi:hypothetical protein